MAANANAVVNHSGINGGASIGILNLNLVKWDVKTRADMVVFKTSLTGKYYQREATFLDCIVTLNLLVDFANPLQSVCVAGQALPNIILWELQSAQQANNGPNWTFTSVICQDFSRDLVVDGQISDQLVFMGNGQYNYPGS